MILMRVTHLTLFGRRVVQPKHIFWQVVGGSCSVMFSLRVQQANKHDVLCDRGVQHVVKLPSPHRKVLALHSQFGSFMK
jgi:hypothetical protein